MEDVDVVIEAGVLVKLRGRVDGTEVPRLQQSLCWVIGTIPYGRILQRPIATPGFRDKANGFTFHEIPVLVVLQLFIPYLYGLGRVRISLLYEETENFSHFNYQLQRHDFMSCDLFAPYLDGKIFSVFSQVLAIEGINLKMSSPLCFHKINFFCKAGYFLWGIFRTTADGFVVVELCVRRP